jgi:hypothetical protein
MANNPGFCILTVLPKTSSIGLLNAFAILMIVDSEGYGLWALSSSLVNDTEIPTFLESSMVERLSFCTLFFRKACTG